MHIARSSQFNSLDDFAATIDVADRGCGKYCRVPGTKSVPTDVEGGARHESESESLRRSRRHGPVVGMSCRVGGRAVIVQGCMRFLVRMRRFRVDVVAIPLEHAERLVQPLPSSP